MVDKEVPFDKIEACGNDFILLEHKPSKAEVAALCDRHHGLGADGIFVLRRIFNDKVVLDHYDPDGSRSFCLNGIRASLVCLSSKGRIPGAGTVHSEGVKVPFRTSGGVRLQLEKSSYRPLTWFSGKITLRGFQLDVGNPQFVIVRGLPEARFLEIAPSIRHDRSVFPKGTNVNWVGPLQGCRRIKTFERGVETFTKACGSGMLAAALVLFGEQGCSEVTFQPDGKGTATLWDHGDHVLMEGSAHWVASGVWLCAS